MKVTAVVFAFLGLFLLRPVQAEEPIQAPTMSPFGDWICTDFMQRQNPVKGQSPSYKKEERHVLIQKHVGEFKIAVRKELQKIKTSPEAGPRDPKSHWTQAEQQLIQAALVEVTELMNCTFFEGGSLSNRVREGDTVEFIAGDLENAAEIAVWVNAAIEEVKTFRGLAADHLATFRGLRPSDSERNPAVLAFSQLVDPIAGRFEVIAGFIRAIGSEIQTEVVFTHQLPTSAQRDRWRDLLDNADLLLQSSRKSLGQSVPSSRQGLE